MRWRRKNTVWSTSDEHKNCLSVIWPSVCEPVMLLHQPSVYLSLPYNPFVLLSLASFCSTLPIHSPDNTTDTKYHTNKSNSNILPYGIWIMNFPEGMQSIMGLLLKAGTRNWEKHLKKKAARARDQSQNRASEDTLLCCTRLSNLTHTLLKGILSRLNPTGLPLHSN